MNKIVLFPVIVYIAIVSMWVAINGIKPSPDGIVYSTGAESISNGQGFIVSHRFLPTGKGYTQRYPPGYSSIIAIGVRAGLPADISALLVNIISGALIIVLLFFVFRAHEVPSIVAAWLCVGVSCNYAHLNVIHRLLSEPIAITLTLAALLSVIYNKPFFAGVLSGVAWTTRNAMASICIALGVYYIFTKQWRQALWCAIGGFLGAGWLVYCNYQNWGVISPYTGPDSERNIIGCSYTFISSIIKMFSPLILCLICVKPSFPKLPIVLWALIFIGVMFYGNLTWKMDELDIRMLAPLLWVGALMVGIQHKDRAVRVFIWCWPIYSIASTSVLLLYRAGYG